MYLSWFTQDSSRIVISKCLQKISLKTVCTTCVSLVDRQHPYAMVCRPMLNHASTLGYASPGGILPFAVSVMTYKYLFWI